MSDWHFKTVLSFDHLALEAFDVLESTLTELVELNDHAFHLSLLLLGTETSSGLIVLHLWESKDSSFHSIDLQGARNKCVELWLPNFTEEVDLRTHGLFMSVKPIEGERSIWVEFQWVVVALELVGLVHHCFLVFLILKSDFFPLLFNSSLLGICSWDSILHDWGNNDWLFNL
jgi:hypothetical protein